jgi:hypothetical protein
MGKQLLDQFSLLHAAVGILAYFWKVPLWLGFLVHATFEWAENTEWGVRFINRYIIEPGWVMWPGGKYAADAFVNQMGDNATFAAGWMAAWWLNRLGVERGWYPDDQK